jgi:predicted secreted hydrolase
LFLLVGCTAPVVVEWSTETEMNTAGFNLYRGAGEMGPFDVKVNEQLIPASPDPMIGGKYSFVDQTARPGVTYYYQLQEVEKTGAVNLHGPIATRAGGFDWRLAVVLGALAAGTLFLWVKGGRMARRSS